MGEISHAKELQRWHKLHVTGEGYKKWWLKRSVGIESENAFNLKKELAKPTTPRIYEAVKKQYAKIWRAKGFVRDYRFKDDSKENKDKLQEILDTIYDGHSIVDFMRVKWFGSMFEEFAAFAGVELTPRSELKSPTTEEPYLRLVTIDEVYEYRISGNNTEYLILHHKVIRGGKEYEGYRVIDDSNDAVYYKEGDELILNDIDGVPDILPNVFGRVPFIQVSQYLIDVDHDGKRESPVAKTMANAFTYLSLSDDKMVCDKIHAHPLFYSFPVTCPTCNGSKKEKYNNPDSHDVEERECRLCLGEGIVPHWKRDPSQGISLPIGEDFEKTGFPAAAAPAGYVQIDTDTMRYMVEQMKEEEGKIEKGALGVEGVLNRTQTRDETALGRELDLQPLMDTLDTFSCNGENVEMFLVDMVGTVMFKDQFIDSYIHYGRKYNLRSEEQVMDEFTRAKNGGAPKTYLRELLTELYYVKFDSNPKALLRALMLLDLEPFPEANSVDELMTYPEYTSTLTLIIKYNFTDFIERFENENESIISFDGEKDYSVKIANIKLKLKEYAKQEQSGIQPKEVAGSSGTGIHQPNN